ncbi:MAG: TIGR04013 family B12-binding domain/radical SAM domain-containing protein [Candidatus Heimdallarchaeota archaeon]
MTVEIRSSPMSISEYKLGIVFRYSRANIFSYHSLIGALEINPHLSDIHVFIPKPEEFLQEINRLLDIEQFNNLIIGISVHSFQMSDIHQLLTILNSHPKRNRLFIIAGGPHPSALPGELLNNGCDAVVIGEGEKTFPELVLALRNHDLITRLKGIAFLNNEREVVIRPKNKPIILDEYPPFAPNYELYSALEITRGCKFGCTYCQVPSLFGKTIRYRSPENAIKWGKFLLSKRETWDFRFITPNAFGYGSKKSSEPNVNYIKKLLSGLKKLEAKKRRRIYFGTFPSEVRPESVTEDTLNLTKEYCDNDNLTMGAQSGSPKILKKIKRGHTVEQAINAVDLANDFGFVMNVDFILGFPEETIEEQYETIDLCKQLIAKNCRIHMHYLIPLPGTKYFNSKPTSIALEILKTIRKWSNDGVIFGSWQHQYNLVRNNTNDSKN